jgi:hypothetical protein
MSGAAGEVPAAKGDPADPVDPVVIVMPSIDYGIGEINPRPTIR